MLQNWFSHFITSNIFWHYESCTDSGVGEKLLYRWLLALREACDSAPVTVCQVKQSNLTSWGFENEKDWKCLFLYLFSLQNNNNNNNPGSTLPTMLTCCDGCLACVSACRCDAFLQQSKGAACVICIFIHTHILGITPPAVWYQQRVITLLQRTTRLSAGVTKEI